MVRRYKTKQLLPTSGVLYIKVLITDHNNKRTFELGNSYNEDVRKNFKFMVKDALMHALYKHFWRYNEYIPKKDYNNDEILNEYIKNFTIKEWWVEYFSENNVYTYKQVIRKFGKGKKHRYMQISKRGKPYKTYRIEYKKKGFIDEIGNEVIN